MANHWAASCEHSISIVTFSEINDSFYPLHESVSVQNLSLLWPSQNLLQSVVNNLKRSIVLRRAIRNINPDVVISFVDTVNVRLLLSLLGAGYPVLISERSDPWKHDIGKVWGKLRSLTYPLADRIVVQSSNAKQFFPRRLSNKIDIIANPVSAPHPGGENVSLPSPLITSIGRQSAEKGHSRLIKAFSQIASRHESWHLALVGDGPLNLFLKQLVSSLGLNDRVHFTGQIVNVANCLQQTELFVLPSSYEGFPNALCEAMASGVAVISTECGAVKDIVHHGYDGLIVPCEDVSALAGAMDALMSDSQMRETFAFRAQNVTERFSLPTVMSFWESSIDKALHRAS